MLTAPNLALPSLLSCFSSPHCPPRHPAHFIFYSWIPLLSGFPLLECKLLGSGGLVSFAHCCIPFTRSKAWHLGGTQQVWTEWMRKYLKCPLQTQTHSRIHQNQLLLVGGVPRQHPAHWAALYLNSFCSSVLQLRLWFSNCGNFNFRIYTFHFKITIWSFLQLPVLVS